jgi:hypothetical protein
MTSSQFICRPMPIPASMPISVSSPLLQTQNDRRAPGVRQRGEGPDYLIKSMCWRVPAVISTMMIIAPAIASAIEIQANSVIMEQSNTLPH